MHIGHKIRELIEKKSISIVDFSNNLGKSRKYIYDIFDKPHIGTELLEKVSHVLDVPISYFFTQSDDDNVPPISTQKDYKRLWEEAIRDVELLKEKLESTKEKLEDKNKLIETYEARIEDLKKIQAFFEQSKNSLKGK